MRTMAAESKRREPLAASLRAQPRGVSAAIQSTSLLFVGAVAEILSTDQLCYDFMDVGRGAWDQDMWSALCGTVPQRCVPHTEKSETFLRMRVRDKDRRRARHARKALIFRDVGAARAELGSAFERSGGAMISFEDCGGIIEVYTFAALCWAAGRALDLDAVVSLWRLREYLCRSCNGADFAIAALQVALERYALPRSLLRQAVEQEELLSYPSVRTPADRHIYDEQKELGEEVLAWFCDHAPRVIVYQSPPSGGKTASVALVACLLHRLRTLRPDRGGEILVVYACFSARVRDHLSLHLRTCHVPFAHVRNHAQDVRLELHSERTQMRLPPLAGMIPRWETLTRNEVPVALLCDLSSATEACKLSPNSMLAFDESCESAGTPGERAALLDAAPQAVLLLSSFLPPEPRIRASLAAYGARWPCAQVSTIISRRMRQSYTGRLPDGFIVVPHFFGIDVRTIAHEQHLSRFYSARALDALMSLEGLEPDEHLQVRDLASHRLIRNACMRLLRSGCLTRGLPASATSASPPEVKWTAHVWREAMAPLGDGMALIFAENAESCLVAGFPIWGELVADAQEVVPTFPEGRVDTLIALAAKAGVVILTGRDAEDAASAYDRWAYAQAQKGLVRCVVASVDAIHGIHLPISRVVLHDTPRSYEAITHLCGRTARQNACQEAEIIFRDLPAARASMAGAALGAPVAESLTGGNLSSTSKE